MRPATRIAWLVTGGLWAARSLLEFAEPDYWNAVTALDFTAVWLLTGCFLGLAATLVLLGRLVPTRSTQRAAAVLAGAALLAGLANGIEDGLGVKSWGTFYALGSLTAWLGMLALAATFARAGLPRLGWVAGAMFVGFLLFNVGGGLIVLGVLGVLAIRPDWFLVAVPETPDRAGAGS